MREVVFPEEINVPDIFILRCDIPVAHQSDLGLRVLGQPMPGTFLELVEPIQLVSHVSSSRARPLGRIGSRFDAAASRGKAPRFLNRVLAALAKFGLAREGALHILKAHAGSDGHAVPLVYAKVRYLVVIVLEQLPRKIIVFAFRFLDSQDIYVGAPQPVLNAVGTGSQRVHIPSCNLHKFNLSSLLTCATSIYLEVRVYSCAEGDPNHCKEAKVPEILTERRGQLGIITLNRPKALNALNASMCQVFLDTLLAWRDEPE